MTGSQGACAQALGHTSLSRDKPEAPSHTCSPPVTPRCSGPHTFTSAVLPACPPLQPLPPESKSQPWITQGLCPLWPGHSPQLPLVPLSHPHCPELLLSPPTSSCTLPGSHHLHTRHLASPGAFPRQRLHWAGFAHTLHHNCLCPSEILLPPPRNPSLKRHLLQEVLPGACTPPPSRYGLSLP